MVTLAFGTAAPLGSVTRPWIAASGVCPGAAVVVASNTAKMMKSATFGGRDWVPGCRISIAPGEKYHQGRWRSFQNSDRVLKYLSRAMSIYKLGQFQIDSRDRLLSRDGEQISLPPLAIETLFVLLDADGHVVTKDEFLRKVWPETF